MLLPLVSGSRRCAPFSARPSSSALNPDSGKAFNTRVSGAFNVIVVGRLLSDDFEWYCYNILLHEFKPTLQLMNSRVDVFMGATAGYPSEGVPTTASSSLEACKFW